MKISISVFLSWPSIPRVGIPLSLRITKLKISYWSTLDGLPLAGAIQGADPWCQWHGDDRNSQFSFGRLLVHRPDQTKRNVISFFWNTIANKKVSLSRVTRLNGNLVDNQNKMWLFLPRVAMKCFRILPMISRITSNDTESTIKRHFLRTRLTRNAWLPKQSHGFSGSWMCFRTYQCWA